MTAVRVCFLTAGPSEHASALARAGADVVVSDQAVEGRFDAVVASGWQSAGELFEVDAAVRALLVSELEHRGLGLDRPERMAAMAALDLPCELLVTSRWLEATIEEQHPHSHLHRVPFGRPVVPLARDGEGPLRVAGAPDAVLAAMAEPHVVAEGDYDIRVALDAEPLSVLVEAFAAGATCLTTPTDGRDELVEHRINGVLVEPGDSAGAAHLLDGVARNPAMLDELRAGARRTAEAWPSWDDAGAELLRVLQGLVDAPPDYGRAWPARLMTTLVGEAAKLGARAGAEKEALIAWGARLNERDQALTEREHRSPESVGGRMRARFRR